MTSSARLKLDEVTKRFGSTVVLDQVSLDVRPGQIHGLIGQNGAGKSTLVKTLAGLYPDHDGEITLDGRRVSLRNPRRSRAAGIAVIYQEFSLVSTMTVAENLLLGSESPGWYYSSRETMARARELVARVGIRLGVPVTAQVGDLSPAIRQRIEIVKALAENVKVLLLDEPTARLSASERHSLFTLIRDLADRGVGIVFISHFLDEVRHVTDWLTVMRNGRVVGSQPTKTLTVAAMAGLMLGEELQDTLRKESTQLHADDTHPVVLEGRQLSYQARLHKIDIDLRAGEIAVVAGLVGSGRTRLCRILAGIDQPTDGQLQLRGRPFNPTHPRHAIAAGIALIPEDRRHQGLCMDAPLTENLTLMALQRGLGRWGVVRRRTIRHTSTRLVHDLQVVPTNIDAKAGTLSGGNQQKIVLGKTLAAQPRVLIIDQPTAGVDVGTKAHIHRLLRAQAEAGVAILVVSDDIDELYALGDRLYVMRQGEIIKSGTTAGISRNRLVKLISVGAPEQA